MKKPEMALNEESRLRDLKSYQILDTDSESTFDEITRLAAKVAGTKIALVSLVDQDRQWFKSCTGLTVRESPRSISFCGHAILQDDIFEIRDAREDERFSENPLVTGHPFVRFYAGIPLKTPSGNHIGTLCVIDESPQVLSPEKRDILTSLSRHIVDLLELRKKTMEVEFLARLFEQSTDAIMTLTPPGWKFVRANPATLRLFGFSSHEEFVSAEPWVLSPEFQPDGELSEKKALRMIATAMETGGHFFEWTHRRSDGSHFPCSVLLSRINQGKDTHLQATVRDLGRQKILEAQLKEAQSISKIGSWTYDLRTREQTWSEEHYKIFEIDPDQPKEILHRLYRERIHPDDLPALDENLDRALKKGVGFVYDHRVVLDGGKRIKHVQGISKVFTDSAGNPTSLTGTCRDRTADFETEERFRLLLEENRFILDSLGIGVWKLDLQTGKQEWDRMLYSLYGLEPDGNSGLDFEKWKSSLAPASLAIIEEEMQSILSGADVFFHTIEIKTPSGESRFLGSRGMAIRDAEGRPTSIHGINWDRTNEVNLEKKLDIERKSSLHHAKLASIGQLAAGVGHEINNPLAIISGLLAVTEHLLKTKAPEEKVREKLGLMDESIQRISNIVKGLRTYARSDTNEITSFDPFPLVRETVNLFKEIYLREGVEIILEKQTQPVTLNANRGRLQQVLVNLITNAKDATIGLKDRRIVIRANFENNDFNLTVSDNGYGIRDEIRDRIFEPFFTTKDPNSGTGLGLSLVSTIVKEHNGTISFVSKEGTGTEFRVRIPASGPGPVPVPDKVKAPVAHHPGKLPLRILIVDDEPGLAELMGEVLSFEVSEVLCATSAREGLSILRKRPIDLVISDVKMPEIDGEEFLRMVRNDPAISKVRFIFLSGGVSVSHLEGVSVEAVLVKPFKLPELMKIIRNPGQSGGNGTSK